MKANEFVKKFALSTVKNQILINDGFCNSEFWNELKRLVESHELVSNFGGLDNAKSLINHFKFVEHGHLIPDGLEKAIADVESCQ